MSDLDALAAGKGVVMAGRFDADWQVAEHREKSLGFTSPAALAELPSFCGAVQMTLRSMFMAMGSLTSAHWSPLQYWSATSGAYTIVVMGDVFAIAETCHLDGVDDLISLLADAAP